MSSMPCPKGNHHVLQAKRWPSPGDLQVHRGASEAIQRRGNVPSSWGCSQWLLRVASRTCFKRGQEDSRLLRLIRASFSASHGIYGAPRVFLDLREGGETCSKHRVARLMRENGIASRSRLSNQACIDRQAVGLNSESASAAVHGHAPEQGVGYRHHLHPNMARLALPGCGDGLVFPQDHRLVDEPDDPSRARSRCRSKGGPTPPPESTLIHSDQGTQYGSDAWRRFCKSNQLDRA